MALELIGMLVFAGVSAVVGLIAFFAKDDKGFQQEILEATGFDKACEKLDSIMGALD